jgi:acetylornithine deacetylase/succinyl-diaminopimelate desuccinylase-like protein
MSSVPQLQPVLDRIDADFDDSLERLFALLRIKSISADPAFAGDCKAAADHLARDIATLGFATEVRPTAGHPAIVAKSNGGGNGKSRPHVLFYGHYDVQPVDPLNLWHRPPFEPAVTTHADGRKIIVARGAEDDKGQVMTFVEACRAWKSVTGSLPIDITIIIEGEEEIGSKNFVPFLEQIKDERWSATPACGTPTRPRSPRRCAGWSMRRSRSRPPTATCIRACSAAGRKIRSGC